LIGRGISLAATILVLELLSTSIIEVIASLATAIIIIVVHLARNLILNNKENLLNQLNDVRFLENTQIRWHALCVQPSLVVEISFIFCFVDLPVADLRYFIVSHVE
jgi:hypothetical protein